MQTVLFSLVRWMEDSTDIKFRRQSSVDSTCISVENNFTIQMGAPKIIRVPIINTHLPSHYQRLCQKYEYVFEVNEELKELLKSIETRYRETEHDEHFRIIPESTISISRCYYMSGLNLSFFGNTIFTDKYSALKLYTLITSGWASYLKYNITCNIKFKNDYTKEDISNYSPYIYLNTEDAGVCVDIDPIRLENESYIFSKKQMMCYSKLGIPFLKSLPIVALDTIAYFLIPHNSAKFRDTIRTSVIKYIETDKYIEDIVTEYELGDHFDNGQGDHFDPTFLADVPMPPFMLN
jgi:hypothetical protein